MNIKNINRGRIIRVGQYDDYEIINYTSSSYSCTQSVIKHENIQ